jgi:hypothetical protein
LSEGRADVVSFATPYIVNPTSSSVSVSVPRSPSPTGLHFYGGNHRGYTDYPSWISRFEVVETT